MVKELPTAEGRITALCFCAAAITSGSFVEAIGDQSLGSRLYPTNI